MKPGALLIGLLVCAAAGLAGARAAAAQQVPDLPSGDPAPAARGPAGATLEIVEFSDFECPFCAGAKPVMDSLLARYPADVRLVYRHYPLPMHGRAEPAAIAAVEAARQGAFWPYHDLLFTHQDHLTDADLAGYADSLGLDTGAFARALRERTHAGAVAADVEMGRALAVHGTPTFFVNGYRLVGVPPVWVFEEVLRAFREGRATPKPLAPPRPPD
jgi:protein-disulfide isomerase